MKTRLTHPQSLSFDSPNSSTLTLSIDISLRGTFDKSLRQHTHISEEVFRCLGSSSERTNSFGWCNGLIAGFGKPEKTRFGVTLLEQEAWIRLGGSSAFHISQLHFLVDYWPLRRRQRGFLLSTTVSSLITHRRVIFVLASLFPFSLPFNCCCVGY